jgi:hypothetical protein
MFNKDFKPLILEILFLFTNLIIILRLSIGGTTPSIKEILFKAHHPV